MTDKRSYALLEKNYGRQTWTNRRSLPDHTGSKTVNKIVIHDPEAHLDLKAGRDRTAEDMVRYARSLTRPEAKRDASWHVSSDTSSIWSLLPDHIRAWQVHHYSESSLGIEMGAGEKDWILWPNWRVNSTLENGARVCAYWCLKHQIPPVILTRAQVDAGQAGMTYHGYVDPHRRTDPGVKVTKDPETGKLIYQVTTFPEAEFLDRVHKNLEDQKRKGLYWPEAWVPQPVFDRPAKALRQHGKPVATALAGVAAGMQEAKRPKTAGAHSPKLPSAERTLAWALGRITYSTWPKGVIKQVQNLVGVTEDGIVGPETRKAVRAWVHKTLHG